MRCQLFIRRDCNEAFIVFDVYTLYDIKQPIPLATRLLGLWVRIPPRTWIFVLCVVEE